MIYFTRYVFDMKKKKTKSDVVRNAPSIDSLNTRGDYTRIRFAEIEHADCHLAPNGSKGKNNNNKYKQSNRKPKRTNEFLRATYSSVFLFLFLSPITISIVTRVVCGVYIKKKTNKTSRSGVFPVDCCRSLH